VDLKVIAKAQKVPFVKIQDQNHAEAHFLTNSVMHKECVSEGRADSSAFYAEVIRRLMKRISRVRPQFEAKCSWF
jgi:hypothetical protein